ncbi:MAG: hypothetical protein E7304_07085 [Butyrivibrio sp.]|uniref:hypothetical protein n=1 Tax=Butyrivibrio sp. TaxID=28121 RepID=UPI001EB46BDE|nr:hypothetical protein [Butyrivibrio sp.]MBE5841152.1 hypothetical protein [Butyrivibrio sp.]
MKELYRKHCLFHGDIYNIVMFVVVPIVIVLLHIWMQSLIDVLNVSNLAVLLMLVGMYADYYSFNGLTAKDYPLGIFKNSIKGRDAIKWALVADQVRRFIQITFIYIVCNVITMNMKPITFTSSDWLLTLVCILYVYASTTTIIIIGRNITTFAAYTGLSGILMSISGVIVSLALFYRYCQGEADPMNWLPIVFVLAVFSTGVMIKYTLYRYDRSFMEEKHHDK